MTKNFNEIKQVNVKLLEQIKSHKKYLKPIKPFALFNFHIPPVYHCSFISLKI